MTRSRTRSRLGAEAGATLRAGEETATFSAIVAELVTQDTEGAWGNSRNESRPLPKALVRNSVQGFVLALGGGIWGEEEGGGLGTALRYLWCW